MKKVAFTSLLVAMLLTGCSDFKKTPDHSGKNDVASENKTTVSDGNQTHQADKSEDQANSEHNQNDSKNDQQNTNQTEENKNNSSDQKKDQSKNNETSKESGKANNQTKNSEGVPVVANPTAITVMVNKSNALPDGYRPSDLVRPKVKFVFGNQKLDKALMRAEAAASLEKMFSQASSQGIQLYAASGFRSYETQDYLFKQEIKQVGRKKAELAVAKPGTSEHQTGLTMDISAPSVNYTLTQNFESKKEGKWLAEHAHEFGFILRYPKGKEDITKYQFEPWHFRYVGKEIATEIYKKGITLEEYIDQKQGI
ncbi:M15 family metallopeptidase [Heyndrickxia sporothermodurans]|uniref:D-alanyl-D-alanine carboxypeptidase n=2 Tax=Heyndrickxia sporothermodurans TaxID=46224 RepID=A0A150KMP3_9BACI|nr:M15 family metallopeptidase [Heyndrickxia sporothermodurans]KYC97542.1 D-alanyl-D-alanine carboxypeptidase [Heyndrickxia sporothermodurans]MEB6550928.1 M15 family metallopeptidase [Heyndrickxia sporothermodurans]MED3651145.1 M15 family metallopeptidase [Heyndrickxia sporothermodurans]MED3655525.1 M15 family metallopeptidase [Heyndrickxia sporothermodurans]MED3698770.1 M15 family metallopeptidase [Heyndrickxia sporothermodurans]